MTDTYAPTHDRDAARRPEPRAAIDLKPGDEIRDGGRLRIIRRVEPSGIVSTLVTVYFEPDTRDIDDDPPHLAVPAAQRVTVWREA